MGYYALICISLPSVLIILLHLKLLWQLLTVYPSTGYVQNPE